MTDLAVIVGAGAMGVAVARRLGGDHAVLLVDRDAALTACEVAALEADGYRAEGWKHDITDAASVAALAARLGERGGWSALVHVAGLSPSGGDARAVLNVNLRGAALVSAALRPLAKAGAAAVFVSSIAGHGVAMPGPVRARLDDPLAEGWLDSIMALLGEGCPPGEAYRLSKHGLNAMCRREAAQWGAVQARIVSVSPGPIDTPMGRRESAAQPQRAGLVGMIPLGREGRMDEVVEAIAFLASTRASFISGTDIVIDGGLTAALEHAGKT